MRAHLPKPSPAMIVACLALFVALTGTGVAVVKALPANSVGTAQLKNNAVNSRKIANHSLKAADFASDQLPKGARGATGPRGGPGATHTVVVTALGSWDTTDSLAVADCPTGTVATGGSSGWKINGSGTDPVFKASWPVDASGTAITGSSTVPHGWAGWVNNDSSTGTVQAVVYAVCASP